MNLPIKSAVKFAALCIEHIFLIDITVLSPWTLTSSTRDTRVAHARNTRVTRVSHVQVRVLTGMFINPF